MHAIRMLSVCALIATAGAQSEHGIALNIGRADASQHCSSHASRAALGSRRSEIRGACNGWRGEELRSHREQSEPCQPGHGDGGWTLSAVTTSLGWSLGPFAGLPVIDRIPLESALDEVTLGKWTAADLTTLEGVFEVDDDSGNAYPLRFGSTPPTLRMVNGKGRLVFAAGSTSSMTTPAPLSAEFFDSARFDPAESWAMLLLVDLGDGTSLSSGPPDQLFGSANSPKGSIRVQEDATGYKSVFQTNSHRPGTTTIADVETEADFPVLLVVFYDGTGVRKLTGYQAYPRFGDGNARAPFQSVTSITDDSNSTDWQGLALEFNGGQHGVEFLAGAVLAKNGEQQVTQALVDEMARDLMQQGWLGTTEKVLLYMGDSLTDVRDSMAGRVPGWPTVLAESFGEGNLRTFNVANAGARVTRGATIGDYWATDGWAYAQELIRLLSPEFEVFPHIIIGTNDIGGDSALPADVASETRALAAAAKAAGVSANIEPIFPRGMFDFAGDGASGGRGLYDSLVRSTPGSFDHVPDTLASDTVWGYDIDLDGSSPNMDDETHPSTLGNRYAAELFYPFLCEIVFGTDMVPSPTLTDGVREIVVTLPVACEWSSSPVVTVRDEAGESVEIGSGPFEGSGSDRMVVPISDETPVSGERWIVSIDNSDGHVRASGTGIALASIEMVEVVVLP